ncbi:MAG: radical SAM protein [Candidatus Coatesbacteria bacterium]|nr:MAG: radical SAM protein [Candidatus Coatesbacteria bacterium]
MRRTPFVESCLVIGRCAANWFERRPLVVSFEVTNSCTCRCRHCDHGGPVEEPNRITAADMRRWMKVLHPGAIQISGGEPLLREDIVDCVKATQGFGGLPYTVFVSNFSLMTEEKYLALRAAGVDQFSVSLDFPDERHDDFRRHPGLFAHLGELLPRLAALGYDDVVLNTALTRENYTCVNDIVELAERWGVNVSFSAYSPRRTGDMSYMISAAEELAELRRQFDGVLARKENDPQGRIVNSCTTLDDTYKYFENGGTPDCTAGLRFLVVTADGYLQPCSMQFHRHLDQRELVREFTANNTCDQCYVAIRSYLDKGFWRLLRENVGDHFSFRLKRDAARA